MLGAFRRNKNNNLIDSILLYEINHLTQNMAEEILDIASASSDRTSDLFLESLRYLWKVPTAISQFHKLESLVLADTDIVKLPYGSMVFNASNSRVHIVENIHLVEIEPGAILIGKKLDHSLTTHSGNNHKKLISFDQFFRVDLIFLQISCLLPKN